MRILFITRNFPPQRGGMERVAFYLYTHFEQKANIILLKWTGGRKLLIFVLPYFLIKAGLILSSKKIDIIYINEGFLSFLGIFLKIFKKPIVITIHGLDITYKNIIYQLVIPGCIAKMDRIICISQATKLECIKRGIPERKICVIPDGIKDKFYIKEDEKDKLKRDFAKKFNINIKNKKILLSVGRLIKRKGIHWFVEEVIPLLLEKYKDFIYVIVGDGHLRGNIEDIIHKKKISNWVVLLGKVSDELLKLVYNISDIFIMPNIPVEGDIEGFGIVALEAASCKLSIVASDLEGIRDALLEGAVGSLIPPLNAEKFKNEILRLLNDDNLRQGWGEKAREIVIKNFRWEMITNKYLEVFTNITR